MERYRTLIGALLLLAGACTNPVGPAPHQWIAWSGVERQPSFTCLCVAAAHAAREPITSISVLGDTLVGHEAVTPAERDDCAAQTRR